MGDGDGALCVELCRQSGWLGEIVVMALIAARAIYVQFRNRQLAAKANELTEKVQQLSLRPPAIPALQLQLPPLPELVRAARASVPASDLQGGVRPFQPESDEPVTR